MPKLKVELMDVYCRDTEDFNTGATDDFYFMGVLVGKEATKAIVTRPQEIDNNQTQNFRKEDSVLFEGNIQSGQSIKGEIKAFDEDAAKS